MRYLAYFLVLANLGYFAWYQYSPPQKPAEILPVPVPSGGNRLLLLSEQAVAEPAVEGGEVEAIEEPAEVVEQLAAVALPAETKDDTDANGSGEAAQDTEVAPEPEPEPDSVAPELLCETVGPLPDTGDVTSISEQLSRHGFQINVRGAKEREPAGYWVYMPAMPAAKARSIVADLDAHGMTDYFIGRKNHISLGIFSTEKKARRRLNRVKRLGYDAELGQRYRSRAVFWLDVEGEGAPLSASQVWEAIQAKHEDVRLQQGHCDESGH